MQLNHLKYFHSVAKEGSFTRAARAMRIQQPTLSKMVRTLEDRLGLVLLERHKTGIRLTRSGTEIFQICEKLFDHVREIESYSDAEKQDYSGPLSFGATDSVASYLVPSVLADFLKRWPKVRPSMFSGTSNLISDEIMEGKIEFGLFFSVPDSDGLQITEIANVPFNLVIAPTVANRKDARRSFVISREIDYPKSRPFPVLEMLRKNEIVGETSISCNNLDAQKELVKQGLGAALLPRFMVKSSFKNGSLSPLQSKREFSYSLKLVTRKGKRVSKNAVTFLEVFQESVLPLL